MMLIRRLFYSLTALICVCPVLAKADVERMEAGPKELEEVGIEEHLTAQVPINLSFHDGEGRKVQLSDIIRGQRPLLLTLNYSDCPMLCSLQLDGLVDGLKQVSLKVGQDYDVLTVSIDPNETVERTARFRDKYQAMLGGEDAKTGWHFLAGDRLNVEAIARTVGFQYVYVKSRKEYAHTAAIMVLSPEGTVSRYLYGVNYPPRDLRLALVEAAEGKVGTTLDRVLLYCFHYDATSGRYAPLANNVMRLGGVLTVLVLLLFLGAYWLHDWRKSRQSTL